VHALEPLPSNMESVRKYAQSMRNIDPLQVALGSEERRVAFRGTQQSTQVFNVQQAPTQHSATAATFRVVRLDDLFERQWRGERLAFLHLDVEGEGMLRRC
jgi:FkbM family methyltransferase